MFSVEGISKKMATSCPFKLNLGKRSSKLTHIPYSCFLKCKLRCHLKVSIVQHCNKEAGSEFHINHSDGKKYFLLSSLKYGSYNLYS